MDARIRSIDSCWWYRRARVAGAPPPTKRPDGSASQSSSPTQRTFETSIPQSSFGATRPVRSAHAEPSGQAWSDTRRAVPPFA